MKASVTAPATAPATSVSSPAVTGQSSARWQVIAAFAALYIIWGSTYLGIRFAIETMPPFVMASTRFLLSGAILVVWARFRGAAWPTRRQWAHAAAIGACLLLLGNGGVVWAEQRQVPSSLVALLVATTPAWVALIDWLRPGGHKPNRGVVAGLAMGFAGVFLLIGPAKLPDGSAVDLFGMVLVVFASLAWAIGSVYSRHADHPASPLMDTGIQALAGSSMVFVVSVLNGDWMRLNLDAISFRSLAAYAYLVIAGGIVAFTAFVWLLKRVEPSRVATYAYVNPVVAVFLGWALAGEALTVETLIASAIIVAGVAIIVTYRGRKE